MILISMIEAISPFISLRTPIFLLDSWTLKMEPIGCPETSVRNYHYLLRNNPEERSFHLRYCLSRISCTLQYAYFIVRLLKKDFDDGTKRLSQNVGNYQYTLCNIAKRAKISFYSAAEPEITHI